MKKIPIEKIDQNLCCVYGCMDSAGTNTDVYGQLTDGVEVNGVLLRGYKATNYDQEKRYSKFQKRICLIHAPTLLDAEDNRREDVNNDKTK